MPRRMTTTKAGTHQALKNSSYESLVVSWLMQDGWQVFSPVLDNGHQTDILISDGPNYHRLQVKTTDATNDDAKIENRWKDSHVDVVIVFSRKADFGFVMPAFTVNRRKINFKGHQKFKQTKKGFLKAFHKL